MRDIIFKAKRLDNGEWIQGDLRHGRSGRVGIHDEVTHRTVEVDPETVGEYIGLTDKNGKHIFEGDIISAYLDDLNPDDETIIYIEWGSFMWNAVEAGKEYLPDLRDILGKRTAATGRIYTSYDRKTMVRWLVITSRRRERPFSSL